MPTSRRYASIATQLHAALPTIRPRLLAPLTCVLVGMRQTVSAQQRQVASAMPLQTAQQSKIQRFRRLLDNAKLTATDIYQPIVQQALTGLHGQPVHVLLDRVVLNTHQNVLVVSLGFRRRSLPLLWKILPHSGSSALGDQQEVLREAMALLPAKVRITVHADSEFRSQELFAWLRMQGWDAILGIRGNVLLTLDPAQAGQPLHTYVPARDCVVYLNEVYLTEDRCGPVHVIGWWDKDERGTLTCYAVMTNLPATWHTYRLGGRRMWIETMFRDWQSGGFALGKIGVTDAARFHRLILLVCLIYLWFVSVGRWLVKRGYRHLLDAGPVHAWHASLFALAVAWQHRLRTFDQPLRVFWFLYG